MSKRQIEIMGTTRLIEEALTDGSRVYNIVLCDSVELFVEAKNEAYELFSRITETNPERL